MQVKEGIVCIETRSSFAWNRKLNQTLQELRFKHSKVNWSMYVLKGEKGNIIYLITYVDDLLVFSNNKTLKDSIINKLEKKFKMRNLDSVSRILSQYSTKQEEITLNQKDYIEEILRKFNMEDCKPVKTGHQSTA